ncbi:MAG TPA: TetR/AcrR family transcriptional regulator [Candidatus Sulfotelmatobacter sp.]|jgi:AcrR family transcriptional regulator|nr:TetR/AcrR family transcriptional regulator [Candidatus Sulfotelmatobacter sp.]
MPRHPDPDLEERVLSAADVLWKRGGEKSLTMRAVAKAAGTNTPAVYRRFKDRQALVRALLRRTVARIREIFEKGETIEDMAEAYVEFALRLPHEYELFYSHVRELSPRKGPGRPRPIRESRPNFAFLEQLLARRFGGSPEDHTQLGLAIWSTLHGTTMLLLTKAIPEGHEEELRAACRAAVKVLLRGAGSFAERK